MARWNARGDDRSVSEPWRDPHIRFFTRRALQRMLTEAGSDEITVGGDGAGFLAYLLGLRRLSPERKNRIYDTALRRWRASSPALLPHPEPRHSGTPGSDVASAPPAAVAQARSGNAPTVTGLGNDS
jgi:hypothetical protein